jgi:phage gp36-like protein
MASYCTRAELSQYGIAADALEDVSTTDQDASISGASDLIDSYLRQKFTLPLVAWGSDIRRACAIVAVYDLIAGNRGYNPATPGDDTLRLRYEDVLAWLKMIANGQVSPEATDSSSGAVEGVPPPSGRVRFASNAQRGWSTTGTRGPFTGGR